MSSEEGQKRLHLHGANLLRPKKHTGTLALLLSQYKSPIILIILLATALSFHLRDHTDALIILSIVLVSGLLGFWQERGAVNAVARLLALVQIKAAVRRDGEVQEIPVEEIVPGDVVLLRAGNVIPGDCSILESVISAAIIVLVIRSRRPFFQSLPGKYLLANTLLVVAATIAFPYTPWPCSSTFNPCPWNYWRSSA